MSEAPQYPVGDWFPMLKYGDDDAEVNLWIFTHIIHHPKEITTPTELYTMASANERPLPESRLDEHLSLLEDSGLITELTFAGRTFYGLTREGKQFAVDAEISVGSDIMKAAYSVMEMDEDMKAAYQAERPSHPPARQTFEQQDLGDQLEHAREKTYRRLILTLYREDASTARVELSESDNGDILAETRISKEGIDWDRTGINTEMKFTERRGEIADADSYEIYVRPEGGFTAFKPERNGTEWHNDILERSLTLFHSDA